MLDILVEICGWVGSLSYMLFAIPQTIKIVRVGNARELSLGFLALMFVGGIFSCIYIAPTDNLPLKANFGMTLITAAIMLKYKLFERK